MANFITNSDNTKVLRKSEVIAMEIQENGAEDYVLLVKTSARPLDLMFETATTENAIKAKAASVLADLES
jgi:hypothetical protein